MCDLLVDSSAPLPAKKSPQFCKYSRTNTKCPTNVEHQMARYLDRNLDDRDDAMLF